MGSSVTFKGLYKQMDEILFPQLYPFLLAGSF